MNLSQYLDFTPTNGQAQALKSIGTFIQEDNKEDFFILLGYAGTGKTTVTKAITAHLAEEDVDFCLVAPTGSAAKTIANKTKHSSSTIHSRIYLVDKDDKAEGVNLLRKDNLSKDYTVYIIDESSMLSDWKTAGGDFRTPNSVMEDLVHYVKQGNRNNKVIFIGDDFQLPPFVAGEQKSFSPALSERYITTKFGWTGSSVQLTEVKRQAEGSLILDVASEIRTLQSYRSYKDLGIPTFEHNRYRSYSLAINKYLKDYEQGNLHKQIIINTSNRSVNWWNKVLRERLNQDSSILSINDHVILQRNWMSEDNQLFLKGEMAIVTQVSSVKRPFGGQNFVDVELDFIDADGVSRKANSKVLLESLNTDHGNLDGYAEQELLAQAHKYNSKFRESQNIFDDEYLGAMRLRHGYAITCHKAQGSEWERVFLEPTSAKFFDPRWTYTAVTRAKEEVFSWAA
jgi:DNA replication protein DnaC